MNQRPDLCETWDLTLPACPPPSRLYALEPLGLGTPLVESLTSYLARLAAAHNVSLRTLVLHEVSPLLNREYLSNPLGDNLAAFWKEAVRALNGTGSLARDWAQALEELTLRADLRLLTFLPWASVLTQQRLLRLTRVWCPDCLLEWQAAGHPLYEPLLWHVSAVSWCLPHQRPLVGQCPSPNCRATLPVLASHFHPGYCSKCSGWLGVPTEPAPSSESSEQRPWQLWAAEMMGNLIARTRNLTVTPHLSSLPDLITAAREQVAVGSQQDLEQRLQLSRHTVNAWRAGQQIPQLESLLRLCYYCGVSLYDVFTTPSGGSAFDQLKLRTLPALPNPIGNRRPRMPMDPVSLRQSLEQVLAQEAQPPPSMRSVAKRLNYSPRELRERFPELSKAICQRRKDYYQVRREEHLLQLKEEVRRAVLEIHAEGFYPSSTRVAGRLSNPGLIRDPLTTRFRHEILQELRLAD